MNLKILYEPYILCFIIALILSTLYYFYEKNRLRKEDKLNKTEDIGEPNIFPKTVISLLSTYIISLMSYYCYKYFSFNIKINNQNSQTNQSGGSVLKENDEIRELKREKIMEKLTIVDDDIDVGILED